MPAHRVVANLGTLSAEQVGNLKVALQASREGKRVVLPKTPKQDGSTAKPRTLKPLDNLRYLDLAVLLELWKQWKLGPLLDELMPAGGAEVAPGLVVATLTLQRCVDAGSKLYAQRWFPRTALPELLGVSPKSFNNTRLHRVLELLDQATPALMRRLPRRYTEQDGAFTSLFLDVTDTWFAGEGPELAERSKTKEGLVLQKIGIVLLCNEHGYPVRWKVLPGRQGDKEAMGEMVRSIQGLGWLADAPLVCDRAMGNTAQIRQLVDSGVRFLTALIVTEFGAYTDRIPYQSLAAFEPEPDEAQRAQEMAHAASLAQQGGMQKVDEDLYVFDLGVVERPGNGGNESVELPPPEVDKKVQAMRLGRALKAAVDEGRYDSYRAAGRAQGLNESTASDYVQLCRLPEDIQELILEGKAVALTIHDLRRINRMTTADEQRAEYNRLTQQVDKTVEAMRLARTIHEGVEQGQFRSYGAAGKAVGLKPSLTSKFLKLLKLPEPMQHEVLQGKAVGLNLNDLLRISTLKTPESQQVEFQRLVDQAILRGRAQHKATAPPHGGASSPADGPLRVRAVAYFNPQMFVEQRVRARQHLQEIERFVEQLNAALARMGSKQTPAKITASVEQKLRTYDLLGAFALRVEEETAAGHRHYRVRLERKPQQWSRRRRYDGFCLLVGHPDLPHSAERLCRLYREKDAIEKDFGVIKGLVQIRPVRHRTDAKVRAHVTLCMLALLLERTLKRRLAGTRTPEAALEILADRCLNRYRLASGATAESAYAMTETTEEHDAILRALQMQHLADDQEIAERIIPR
jgi:hypothetical protein